MSIIETPTVDFVRRQSDSGATTDHHHQSSKRKSDDNEKLQFFVIMHMLNGKRMVMQGWEGEIVESIHERIERITRIPVHEQRLLYDGKRLEWQKNLRECGIQNDAIIDLVMYLRSGPNLSPLMDDLVSLIRRMCRGEVVHEASKTINHLMTMHFNVSDYFKIFMLYKVPMALFMLYVSPFAGNKDFANSTIRHFLSSCRCPACPSLQWHRGSMDVALEFCKLVRQVGCDDSLYIYCRYSFWFLVQAEDRVLFRNVNFLWDIFPFVREIADSLLRDLELSINFHTGVGKILCTDVKNFIKVLVPFKIGIGMRQALEGSVTFGFWHEEDPLFVEVVDNLRIIYIRLLSKMDECLYRMEDCLANKEQGERDLGVIYLGWSQYLSLLKELYIISKLCDGDKEQFWIVLMNRRSMISQLIVRYAKRTDDNHWILEHKSVTNFESRRHLAMLLFPDEEEDYDELYEMLIDRSKLLTESFEYIARAEPESLQAGLFMEFKNEEATGPGVLREWFLLVCQAIFNPQNALFVACPNDRRRFFPNPASKVHPLHLEYFSFSGRIIALALMNRVQVGIVFDRVFYKQLAGKYITLEDIRDADPYLYSSCKQILEMDADFIDSKALGLTFVREVEELGYRKVIELCPDGKSLVVNSKNREKYVHLLIQNHFVTSISEQVSHFTKGFADILSNSKLQQFFQILELEDLDRMLHGSEKVISVEDWKAHTECNGYKETDCQISWFWEIVGRMSAEQRKVLLFFWTSVKYLPVEGFHGLASRLYISRSVEPEDQLPSSHTCFYQLFFPPYSSMAVMQDRLGVITQEHIGCSFGTW